MSKIDRIDPPRWMASRAVRKLIDVLQSDGKPARFVGGCVRDAILRRPAGDIDIATPHLPDQVMAKLKRAKIKCVATGVKHGTVTAIIQKKPYEITTLRADIATDGRHATVRFTDDFAVDAARRDFTMNAIYADVSGNLYDPTDGIADALAGRIRFVGDPSARIAEDYLRILRMFRFYAHYGKVDLDASALLAAKQQAENIQILSGERIREEFLKILSSARAAGVLQMMHKLNVLQYIIDINKFSMLEKLISIEKFADPMRRLAAVVIENQLAVDAVADKLKLSNAQKSRIDAINTNLSLQKIPFSSEDASRIIYFLGGDAARDLCMIWAARGRINQSQLKTILRAIADWRRVEFPINGYDVAATGAKGQDIGRLLTTIEHWWADRNFAPSRDECLSHLRELAGLA